MSKRFGPNDRGQQILAFIAASAATRQTFGERGVVVTDLEIQDALEIVTGKSAGTLELLDLELSSQSMLELLEHFDFSRVRREILEMAIFPESLLPPGLPGPLEEQIVRIRGEQWSIHKYDCDPFPSTPHAHNYERGYVVHLGSGKIFDKYRREVARMKRQHLLDLRSKIHLTPLPALEDD